MNKNYNKMSKKLQKKKHNSSNIYLKDNNNDTKTLLKISMLNEFLLSNNNGFKINIKKRQSKTPSKTIKRKARTPLPFSPKGREVPEAKIAKTTKNSQNNTIWNNKKNSIKKINNTNKKHKNLMNDQKFREMNTSPLVKHNNKPENCLINKNSFNSKKGNQNNNNNNGNNIRKKQLESNKSSSNLLSHSEGYTSSSNGFQILSNLKNEENEKNKEKKIEDINLNKETKISIINNPEIENKLNILTPNNITNNLNKNNQNIISPPPKSLTKSSSVPNFSKKPKVQKKIYKIETLSQVGFSGPGIPKHNQDNFFIYKNLNDEPSTLFIGVCDGHGIFGHDVSGYLINHLPKNLNASLKKTNKYISHRETLFKTLKDVFISTNKSLCQNSGIDTQFSGSTCVSLILTKNKIVSANAGDSRAVMGRYQNEIWESIDLSRDLKPDTPGEKERILKCGGRIEAYKDENGGDFGPKRVWLKDEDIPGLAMSRSFGDEVAASVGTISEPEIMCFDISKDDKFIIVASDGIWEFISSQECIKIIGEYYWKRDLVGCLKYLLNESSKRWIKEEEVIDDITAVIIFFEE